MAEFVPGAKAVPGFLFLEGFMSERESDVVREGEVLPAVGRGRPPVQHQFKPGNPGRPKGSRNKLGEHFIAALCADFEAHGARVIERVREEEPSVYLRVIARVVPPSMLLQHEGAVAALSDEELEVYLAAVRDALAARDEGASVAAVGG